MIRRSARVGPEKIIHINHMGGHHGSFIELFGRLHDLKASVGPVNRANFWLLVRADQLMFGTLDDDVRGFVLVGIARALRGRRTAGIFMRPQSCFFPGPRGWLKRQLFRCLKHVPRLTILSLLPFEASPELRSIATGAVHDPQLWDVVDEEDVVDEAFSGAIVAEAAGRPIVTFLGTVAAAKGIGHLAAIVAANPDLARTLCILVAGRVQEESRAEVEAMARAGALVWDRRISDAELASLYRASAAVWACYHPDYDQASGIFGRAVQRGRRPIIRDGAVIVGYYSCLLGIDAIRLPDDPPLAIARLAKALKGGRTAGVADPAILREWREEFIRAVRQGIEGRPL